MPTYVYSCDRHGPFDRFRPMVQAGLKSACPTCGRQCERHYDGQAVMLVTDTALFTSEHLGTRAGVTDDTLLGNRFRKQADKAGVVTRGKQYIGGIARYPGDPQAWVSSRAEIAEVAKKRNLKVTGIVNVDNNPEPPPAPGIAEDIVGRYVKRELAKNPGAKREKLVEDAVNKLARPGAKRIIKKPKGGKRPK